MKGWLLIVLFLWIGSLTYAQSNYQEAIAMGDNAFKKQEFQKAIDFYFAAEAFDPERKEEVKRKVIVVFERIEKLKEDAERANRTAQMEKEKAYKQALTTYANDLAYKSKIALRDGDLNSAFKLAEFGHRYVEPNNLNIVQGLLEALHSNERKAPRLLLRFRSIKGKHNQLWSMMFSNDGKQLFTGSIDRSVKIWDTENGSFLFENESMPWDMAAVSAFSPDGLKLGIGTFENTLEIYDNISERFYRPLTGHSGTVNGLAFSMDGKRIVTGSDDKTAIIWDFATGTILTTLRGHSDNVFSVAFSLDARYVATGSDDKTVRIWGSESGELLTTLIGHEGRIFCTAFSPDGISIATCSEDGTSRIWDFKNGKLLAILSGHSGMITSLAYSPNGKYIATGSYDKTVKIWDTETGKLKTTLIGHSEYLTRVVYSNDGKKLATGSWDGDVRIWEMEGPNFLHTFPEHTSPTDGYSFITDMSLSPDRNRLAVGSAGEFVKIWDTETGDLLTTISAKQPEPLKIVRVSFSPNGKHFATNVSTNGEDVNVWDIEKGEISKLIYTGQYSSIEAIEFSPAGKLLLIDSSRYGSNIQFWNLDKGECLTKIPVEGYLDMTRESNFAYFFDGNNLAIVRPNNEIKILNLDNGETITKLPNKRNIKSIIFSSNGKHLVTCTKENTIEIWDTKIGKIIFRINEFEADINSVAISPDGILLAAGLSNGFLKIWDARSGRLLINLTNSSKETHLVKFSSDSKLLATGCYDNSAQVWRLDAEEILKIWENTGIQSELAFPMLTKFNLLDLLNLRLANESILISTKEAWQIKAFADLDASEASSSNILEQVEPRYSRSERLYSAALDLQDKELIRMDYAKMLRNWADVYESNGMETKAKEKREKADSIWKEKQINQSQYDN